MNLLDTASLVVTPNGYKASKLYSIIPSDGTGDMTFARTGDTATRVNSSGLIAPINANIPRLDYLGSTCPKLLLEPQRTNELTYSDAFDNAAWTKSGATISSNAVASPDGTTNADKLVESSNNESHFIYKTIGGSSKTFSFFVKAAERNWVGVVCDNGTTYFNISTGVVGTIASGVTAKIENYGNGWFRCSITSPHTSYAASVYLSTGNGIDSYLGNGTSGAYIWGMQLEAGAYATSYIPTTTASVTRNVDSCSKTSATALIGQTEGTIFVDFFVPNSNTEVLTISKSSPLNLVRFRFLSGIFYGQTYVDGGAFNLNSSVSAGAIGSRAKLAIGYKSGSVAFYYNGILIASSSGTFSNLALDTIELAAALGTSNVSNNNYNSIIIWKTRLQNSELATLTSL